MSTKRRTQEERRNETQALVLEKACFLFGQKGYNNTSLQDIADDCQLTIRPIYHYFGNKKQLFLAVTEHMELLLMEKIEKSITQPENISMTAGWHAFLETASDTNFQQIILIDAPNILGRERWATSSVVLSARNILLSSQPDISEKKAELITRMVIAALAEAALMIAEIKDMEDFTQDINQIIESFIHTTHINKAS